VLPVEDGDLPVVIGLDVRAGRQSQHGEGFADRLVETPEPGDAKPGLAYLGEQPLVFSLLLFVSRIGELVEAVGGNEAASGREFAALRAEIVHRLAVRPGPAPTPLHQVARLRLAPNRAHDRRGIRDSDILARLDVRLALGEADFDSGLRETVEQRSRVG